MLDQVSALHFQMKVCTLLFVFTIAYCANYIPPTSEWIQSNPAVTAKSILGAAASINGDTTVFVTGVVKNYGEGRN